jgi:hypothetical protein
LKEKIGEKKTKGGRRGAKELIERGRKGTKERKERK